ncbi:c-type cytochrome [Limimaricola litoreus]|uniref:Cytochrome c n=1 Tax=Limimaricola litoreus TaxID=2955316 RepID=A0A9X2FWW0_9RHOB|nr:cytochrome c [Limimaricola litoreus]MCP1169941.1 cytochrome c [Limimaricola litoreus]
MMTFKTPLAGLAFAAVAGGTAAANPDHDLGRNLFTDNAFMPCSACHALADAGAEGAVGPDLDVFAPTIDQVRVAVTSGIGIMPAFSEDLSEEEIEAISAYVAAATGSAVPQEGASDLAETPGGADAS